MSEFERKLETPGGTEAAPINDGLTPEAVAMAKFFSNLNPGQVETFKNLLNSLPTNAGAPDSKEEAHNEPPVVKEGPDFTVQGVTLVSAPTSATLEGLYRWRKERSIQAETEVKKLEAQIESYRSSLENINNSTETIRASGNVISHETISSKLESDRHTLLDNLQDTMMALTKAQAVYEYHRNKVVYWEHKGNNLAERLALKIEKVLLPPQAEFEVLKTKQQHVTEKLANLKSAQDMGKQTLDDLRARLKQNPSALDDALIRNTLEEVEGLLQLITKQHDEATSKVESIAARVQKSNLSIADIARNLQLEKSEPHENTQPSIETHAEPAAHTAHIEQPSSPAPETSEKAPEEVKIIIVEKPIEKPVEVKEVPKPVVDAAPVVVQKEEEKPATPPKQPERLEDGSVLVPIVDISETKDHVTPPPGAPHDTVLRVEHLKSEPRVRMAEHATINGVHYLATWNKQYGHELKLSEQEIGAFRPTGVIWDHLSIDEVEKITTAALVKKAGRNRTFYAEGSIQTIYSDDEIAKRLLALRDAYVRDFPPKTNEADTKLAKAA